MPSLTTPSSPKPTHPAEKSRAGDGRSCAEATPVRNGVSRSAMRAADLTAREVARERRILPMSRYSTWECVVSMWCGSPGGAAAVNAPIRRRSHSGLRRSWPSEAAMGRDWMALSRPPRVRNHRATTSVIWASGSPCVGRWRPVKWRPRGWRGGVGHGHDEHVLVANGTTCGARHVHLVSTGTAFEPHVKTRDAERAATPAGAAELCGEQLPKLRAVQRATHHEVVKWERVVERAERHGAGWQIGAKAAGPAGVADRRIRAGGRLAKGIGKHVCSADSSVPLPLASGVSSTAPSGVAWSALTRASAGFMAASTASAGITARPS